MAALVAGGARPLKCSVDEYLADPCAVPSLSSGVAHALVALTPEAAYAKHPRLGGVGGAPGSKAMNDGTLIHNLLLGKGKDVVVIDAPNYQTKLAQTARDQAIAAGRVPVLRHESERLAIVANILRDKLLAKGVVFGGQSEFAVEWLDAGDVHCRCMFDHVYIDEGWIFDLKKVARLNPRELSRCFVQNGLDIQYAAYTRALAALRPELAGRIDMAFVYVDIEPPYGVWVGRPDGAHREIGTVRWEQALRIWKECLAADRWPGWGDGVIEAPPWVIAQELGSMDL